MLMSILHSEAIMGQTRRAQILMEPETYHRLEEMARRERTSVAELIRRAVREKYGTDRPGRQAALEKILSMDLPADRWEDIDEALVLAASITDLIPDLLPVRKADLDRARALLADDPTLSVRDAVHAGTLLAHGLDRIISLDKDFDRIPGISRIKPTEALVEGAAGSDPAI